MFIFILYELFQYVSHRPLKLVMQHDKAYDCIMYNICDSDMNLSAILVIR